MDPRDTRAFPLIAEFQSVQKFVSNTIYFRNIAILSISPLILISNILIFNVLYKLFVKLYLKI